MRHLASRGFSMIEVALALAVIGIAMVSILGLLAIGLNATRDATDDNVAAQIVQAMVVDRQSTPFTSATLSPLSRTTFAIPALNGAVNYTLYFPKGGGVPTSASVANSSYFVVDIKKNTAVSSDFADLAILDFQVSWPAIANITNRMTYFYTTAIGKK